MRRLANHARARDYFDELYAETADATFALAPENTPKTISLPHFDLVSGGAIANAALFALARLPGVVGGGRVLDNDVSALSKLNRNALLVRSALEIAKVTDLARRAKGIAIDPEPVSYVMGTPLAPIVLVGVDDIPSRWAVQAAAPYWRGAARRKGSPCWCRPIRRARLVSGACTPPRRPRPGPSRPPRSCPSCQACCSSPAGFGRSALRDRRLPTSRPLLTHCVQRAGPMARCPSHPMPGARSAARRQRAQRPECDRRRSPNPRISGSRSVS
jgi:hypothetical protein